MEIKAIFSIIILIILIMGCTSNPSKETNWDGGKWGKTQQITPEFKFQSRNTIHSIFNVNYSNKIYFFYSLETKTTDNGDDAIAISEYSIYDIFCRSFDGESWSNEKNLTSPNDDISSYFLSAITFNDKIYVFTMDSWISDNSTLLWGSRTSMMTFDGNNWERTTVSFDKNNETKYGRDGPIRKVIQTYVWKDKIWTLWNINRTEFKIKTFDGDTWGEQQNLTFPGVDKSNENNIVYSKYIRFIINEEELWCTWVYFFVDGGPGSYLNRDHGIYLGKFNGTIWDEWYKLNGTVDYNERPDIILFNKKIITSWESGVVGGSEKVDILMNSYNGSKINSQERVSTDPDGNFQVDMCVFQNKLFFVWRNSVYDSNKDRIQIRRYSDSGFSKTVTLSDSSHPVGDYPTLFTLKDKLWVYWVSYGGVGKCNINIKGYS